jgi:CDP-diglyceride synthetase
MKKRIISSIVMLLIAIPVFIVGGIIYTLGIMFLAMLGLKEYFDVKETKKELPTFIKLISYLFVPLILLSIEIGVDNKMIIDFRIITGLCLIMLLPLVLYHKKEIYSINDACFVFTGVLFLGVAMSFFNTYYQMDSKLLLYLLLITVLTDSFALFTGKLIGKTKLLEDISPNKTWEGFIGGAILGSFVSIMFYKTVVNTDVIISNLIAVTLFLSIIGQLGDLFFSAIKRYFNKKDFSNLMPGHGGVLDRLDSIIFVMLAYSMFITLL